MTESGFSKVTREGIERNIDEAVNAGDGGLVNYNLDLWPTGRPREEITLEAAHHIAKGCTPLKNVVALNNYRKAA